MKKIFFSLLMIISVLSIINVKAETCDPDKISIESISVEGKNDNTEEVEAASSEGKNIKLNLSMSEVGDNIKYKIVVKNASNKDYKLDEKSLNVESEYIDYKFETEDKNYVVKANTSKVVYLNVEYKKEIPSEAMENDTYKNNKTIALKVIDNDITNPKTQRSIIIFSIIAILIVSTITISIKKKKYAKPMLFLIGLLLPITAYAMCEANIEIELQLKIASCVPFNDESSWEGIANSVKHNKTECMNVGDTKTVDMGTFGTHTVRIANKSTPTECGTEGFSQTACGFVVEFADTITTHRMNPSSPGSMGGWPVTEMRTYVNDDIYNALPTDLRSGIIDTTVVSGFNAYEENWGNFTSTDKLYLLATHEVWKDVDGDPRSGIDYWDTTYEDTRQLDYYSSLSTTTSSYEAAIKKNNGSSSWWFLRSPNANTPMYFYIVNLNGGWSDYGSQYSQGVSPAFRIG